MPRQRQKRINKTTLAGLIRDYSVSHPELIEKTQRDIREGRVIVVEG